LDALRQDHRGQRHERDAVDLGGQDLGALEPEREAAARGAGGKPGRHQRQGDRAGVGQHVSRVREQGQRVGQDADHDLERHEGEDQCQRGAQAGTRRVGRVVMVIVTHHPRW
jgi:hypothetical protein